MPTLLNVLIAEDSPDDAELILRELRRADYTPRWKRVETELDFVAELKNAPDIVLSDFSMPQFSGLRAAELLQESGLHIPFILISGTVGEDVAVAAMKHGATDYLLKDRIARLGVAVQQALAQKRLRDERKLAEAELIRQHAELQLILDGVPALVFYKDRDSRFLRVNRKLAKLLGTSPEAFVGKTDSEMGSPISERYREDDLRVITSGEPISGVEEQIHTADGTHWLLTDKVPHRDEAGRIVGVIGFAVDITARKRAEEEIQNQLQELQRWHEVMLDREERILELKREVNELLFEQFQPARYSSSDAPDPTP